MSSAPWSHRETLALRNCFVCFGSDWEKIAIFLHRRTPAEIKHKFTSINSNLVVPEVLHPLDNIDFTEIYLDLQNS